MKGIPIPRAGQARPRARALACAPGAPGLGTRLEHNPTWKEWTVQQTFTLPAGQSRIFVIKEIFRQTIPNPVTNTASVASSTTDPNLANNKVELKVIMKWW